MSAIFVDMHANVTTLQTISLSVGNSQEQESSKPPDRAANGNDIDVDERMTGDQPMMVEGRKYVRHPEDDATFLVCFVYIQCMKKVYHLSGLGSLK